MSGLLAVYQRTGEPVSPRLAARMIASLAHRGRDGDDVRLGGDLALGHQHHWTTPEEVGERQPLTDLELEVDLAFDGRLDNRVELLAELGADGAATSDAALVLAAYRHWGQDCFARLLGPFAVVVHDRRRRRVVCARDPVGARTLVYHLTPFLLVAASEEAAVLAHPAVSDRIDEDSAARFFVPRSPRPGRTYFESVAELPPGHLLEVDADSQRLAAFREVAVGPRLRYRRDDDYSEHFRELLATAVGCRLRSPAPPAVLMSGGLDSTAIAATAAACLRRDASAGRPPERVRAVSWVFDELHECDERRYIDPVVVHCDLAPVRLAADDLWPLRGGEGRWPRSTNGPLSNPYRLLLDRAYEVTRETGTGALLTGWFGDELYAGADGWWLDLVADGRWADAAAALVAARRSRGAAPARPALRPLLHRLPGAALARRLRARRRVTPWLTVAAGRELDPGRRSDPFMADLHAWTVREESRFAARAGLDLRLPYRDRRLIEFVLSLPAHQLYRPGREKELVRRAAAGLLPEVVRSRRDHTSLAPLFARGLGERALDSVHRLLYDLQATWQRHVNSEWLSWALASRSWRGVEAVVPWQCLAWEVWMRGRTRTPTAGRFEEVA